MPTTIKKTIGNGKDYATLTAWFADIGVGFGNTNLVANDELLEAEVHGTVTDSVVMSGLTTDATRYVHIYAASEYAHYGDWRFGAVLQPDAAQPIIDTLHDFIRISGLIFKANQATGANAINVRGDDTLIERCFFIAGGSTGSLILIDNTAIDCNIKDCAFFGSQLATGQACVEVQADAAQTANCVMVNTTIIGSGGHGLLADADATGAATFQLYNTAMCNVTGTEYAKAGSGGTEAYGINGGVFGNTVETTSTSKTTAEMYFVSTTAGLEDHHILDDSALVDTGVDSSGETASWWLTPTDKDLNGNVRDGTTWSAGAHEHIDNIDILAISRRTEEPFYLHKFGRGARYDGSPEFSWNQMLHKLDSLLTQADDDADTNEATIQATQANGIYSRENFLINPDFRMWQRGTTITSPAQYAADAWYTYNKTTAKRVASISTDTEFSVRITPKANGVTVGMLQEAKFYGRLPETAGAVTFSCDVKCSSANVARIGFKTDADSTITYSSYHTGSGSVERLLVQGTMGTFDYKARVYLELTTAPTTATTADFGGAALSLGHLNNPIYVPPSNEQQDHYLALCRITRYTELWVGSSEISQAAGDEIGELLLLHQGDPETGILSFSTAVPNGVETDNETSEPQLPSMNALFSKTDSVVTPRVFPNTGVTYGTDANTRFKNVEITDPVS